jgi:hypothetical protein
MSIRMNQLPRRTVLVLAAALTFLLVAAFPHLYAESTKLRCTIAVPPGEANLSEERALPIARKLIEMSATPAAGRLFSPQNGHERRVLFHQRTLTMPYRDY